MNIVFKIPVSSLSNVSSLYSSLHQPKHRCTNHLDQNQLKGGGATLLTSSSFNRTITMLKQSDSLMEITSDEIINNQFELKKIKGLYSKNKVNWRHGKSL